MEMTELSLAPRRKLIVERRSNSPSSESENNRSSSSSRKRKFFSSDHQHYLLKSTGPPTHTNVDLHVKDPLPLDWEQCLDLESGRMYYLNRKTLRKSWNWPKDQKLDLELNNISPISDHRRQHFNSSSASSLLEEVSKKQYGSSSTNMVALACLNCHLLVILSRSSPSCPNCKYVHSLPITHQQPPLPKISPTKSLNTLSLLN